MWSGQNRSVIFTMLGSVQSCNLVEPTTFGQYACKAITIVPFGEAWRKFQSFMADLYGQGQMRGPFDFGCLLTLSGRREGYSTLGVCLVHDRFCLSFRSYFFFLHQTTLACLCLSLQKRMRELLAALEPLLLQSGTTASFRTVSTSIGLVCIYLQDNYIVNSYFF